MTWKALEDSLPQRKSNQCFSSNEVGKFHDYVASVHAGKRVPLLLEAYQVYGGECHGTPRRGCNALVGDEREFEKSVASVLISALLKSRLKPTKQETCDILKNASHYCGHGSDVLTPVDFIEIAFQGKPFTPKLFQAARTYRETLYDLTGSQAVNTIDRLNWVIWHDVSKPHARCYTGAIQRAIAEMDGEEVFAWQWLLRKTVPGFRPGRLGLSKPDGAWTLWVVISSWSDWPAGLSYRNRKRRSPMPGQTCCGSWCTTQHSFLIRR